MCDESETIQVCAWVNIYQDTRIRTIVSATGDTELTFGTRNGFDLLADLPGLEKLTAHCTAALERARARAADPEADD